MLKHLTDKSLNFIGLEREFEFINRFDDEISFTKQERTDESNIFKVPKYLERVKYYYKYI